MFSQLNMQFFINFFNNQSNNGEKQNITGYCCNVLNTWF